MATQLVNMLNQVIEYGKAHDLCQFHTEDETLNGRTITIDGNEMINFGSCSVLGMEYRDELKQGVIDAVTRYGTQFSSSRTYVGIGMYEELESLLNEIFEKPVLVSATTTLGHLSAIPTLVDDNDAVILDIQVHSSIQMTTEILKARGVTVTLIRHNDMEGLERKIMDLKAKHDKVWYFADGVYSMYGDYAPLDELEQLLDKYKQFNLYIDDAHGMTWAGKKGVGLVRSKMKHHERMVLAVSLNKTFGAAGGCLVFPDQASRDLVRNCGGTMIFSGPIQPPMLGAAIASARMHLNGQVEAMQEELLDLLRYTSDRIRDLGLPLIQDSDSPLFFIPVGKHRVTYDILGDMLKAGYFMNPATFPATSMKRTGMRFLVNLALTKADIDAMLDELVVAYTKHVIESGSSFAKVAKTFRIDAFEPRIPMHKLQRDTAELQIEIKRSINEMDATDWDTTFAGKGNFNASTLKMVEEVFSGEDNAPENQWDFFYFTARDAEGKVVLKTFFTSALVKEDMFHSGAVSAKVEARRADDPYYMTTKSIMLGSLITKGEHLFLDRNHPQWKNALQMLIDRMQETVEEVGAGQLLLREFMGEQDAELQDAFYGLGLVRHELPNVCTIQEMSWKDEAEYMSRLGSRYRYDVRREIIKHRDKFVMTTVKPETDEEIRACYKLYESVFERSFEINVFKLPFAFFKAMCQSEEFEIIRLYLKDGNRPVEELDMVAVMFSHVSDKLYSAMIVGMDYRVLRSHEVYKQVLYRTVWQAWYHKCESLDLAFTAEAVKKKVGARPVKATAYLQVMDHFNQAVLASLQKAS
ncbi:MAG: aminotransferase class I/II-fold pyridoxal phosphate-dependent enzyme [Bacteroidota bacterium]